VGKRLLRRKPPAMRILSENHIRAMKLTQKPRISFNIPVITAYVPDDEHWIDTRTRKKNK
jgi:hypothetical protein